MLTAVRLGVNKAKVALRDTGTSEWPNDLESSRERAWPARVATVILLDLHVRFRFKVVKPSPESVLIFVSLLQLAMYVQSVSSIQASVSKLVAF